ncbi:MAG: MoxR family ATPase [Eubacterium sp.]|nr:MoxR family ATPase [Eubacterium sp.]
MSQENIKLLVDNISEGFIGKESTIEKLLVALLAGGHVLIEDVPGVGKTTLAKRMAQSLEMKFGRIQCTPDTLPTDIVGTSIFSAKTGEFEMVKGPVFCQLFLADEINRTSPKTQSALLEAMEEHQVTIDGTTFALPNPFMVIATQNPVEQLGTYPLPEAELDRFMMKMSIGYPEIKMESILAKKYLNHELDENKDFVLTSADIIKMKEDVNAIILSDELIEYALTIIGRSRNMEELEYGLSPRAGLDLMMASKAWAYIKQRDYVIPEDIISMCKLTLPHRMVLTTKSKMNRYTAYQLMIDIIDKVKRPE